VIPAKLPVYDVGQVLQCGHASTPADSKSAANWPMIRWVAPRRDPGGRGDLAAKG
jgi:hypothetical protein